MQSDVRDLVLIIVAKALLREEQIQVPRFERSLSLLQDLLIEASNSSPASEHLNGRILSGFNNAASAIIDLNKDVTVELLVAVQAGHDNKVLYNQIMDRVARVLDQIRASVLDELKAVFGVRSLSLSDAFSPQITRELRTFEYDIGIINHRLDQAVEILAQTAVRSEEEFVQVVSALVHVRLLLVLARTNEAITNEYVSHVISELHRSYKTYRSGSLVFLAFGVFLSFF